MIINKMDKIQENLYFVDRILRLELQKKEIVAVVKWENFSYRQVTREKLDTLKNNPGLRPDIEKKEAQFKIRPFVKSIQHQLADDTRNLRRQLYQKKQPTKDIIIIPEEDEEKQVKIDTKMVSEEKELTIYQHALCNFEASSVMQKRMKSGLGNFDPKDYFKLSELLHEAWKRSTAKRSRKEMITESAIEEIKGVQKDNQDFKFCLSFKSKVFSCHSQKVLELCPNLLLIYLTKLLKFIKKELRSEIEKEENLLRSKRFKAKSIDAVRKMLNITQHMQLQAKAVHFGLHHEDLQNNIALHKKSFLQIQDTEDERQGRESQNIPPNKKQLKEDLREEYEAGLTMAEELKTLYLDIKNEVLRTLKGDPIAPQPKRSKKKSTKAQKYISVDSSRSASRSKNKRIDESEKRSQISRTPSKQPRQNIEDSNSSYRGQEVIEKTRRKTRGRGRGRGPKSSYSVNWSSSEQQLPSSPKQSLKRLISEGESESQISKRFRRI